jgi:hypothetical protein
MGKLMYWLFAAKVALCDCHTERRISGFANGRAEYEVRKIGTLPVQATETSGLANRKGHGTFWTHNDGNNPSELYEIDNKGKLISTLVLPQIKNVDWEDMAEDDTGNVYLADLGNNYNSRQDLRIYKFNPARLDTIGIISIRYGDQKSFPPAKNAQNFDCEAVAWHAGKLYLFSKNRSKSDKLVKMYSVPDRVGDYVAMPQDSVLISTMVTGADVSPDGKLLGLMTYGKAFLFDISDGKLSLQKPTFCIKTGHGQTESILFINNRDFIFTNERQRGLYLVSRP